MKRNIHTTIEVVTIWEVTVTLFIALAMGLASIELNAQHEKWFMNVGQDPFGLGYIEDEFMYQYSFADLDNDGDEDLFVLKTSLVIFGFQRDAIYYHENIGTSLKMRFAPTDSVNTFGIPDTVAGHYNFVDFDFLDIDNDGDLDLFTTVLYQNGLTRPHILFFENTGSPELAYFGEKEPIIDPFNLDPRTDVPIPAGWWLFTSFADMDGDGDQDVFISGFTWDSFIYQENIGIPGAPLFDTARFSPFGLTIGEELIEGNRFVVKAADWDGDGDPDLMLYGNLHPSIDEYHLAFYENEGTSTDPFFSAQGPRALSNNIRPHVCVDIDGDKDQDILFDGALYENFLYNEGFFEVHDDFGGFIDMSEPEDGDQRFTELADIDSDGDLDMFVLTLNNIGNPCFTDDAKSLAFFENVSDDTTNACPRYERKDDFPFGITEKIKYLKFVDIDGDEDLDLFGFTWCEAEVVFMENLGTPEYPMFDGVIKLNPFGLNPDGMSAVPSFADIDNDGDYDSFQGGRTNGNFHFQENLGDAQNPEFGDVQEDPFGLRLPFTPNGPILVNHFDFDCDNDLDIFLTLWSIEIKVDSFDLYFYENVGTPEDPLFEGYLATGDEIFVMTHGDMDGDGDKDAFFGGTYCRNARISPCVQLPQPEAVITYAKDGEQWFFDASNSTYTATECNPAHFFWDFGDGSPVVDAISVSHTFPGSGLYTVYLTVEDIAGISFTSEPLLISAIREAQGLREVLIYPNPASNYICVEHNNRLQDFHGVIEIYDLQGREVYNRNVNLFADGPGIEIPLNNFLPGLYTIRLVDSKTQYIGQVVILSR